MFIIAACEAVLYSVEDYSACFVRATVLVEGSVKVPEVVEGSTVGDIILYSDVTSLENKIAEKSGSSIDF